MWDINDIPQDEAMQAEQEMWEAIAERDDAYAPLATEADAHAEWHRNTGVPMGTPGCPQDACHLDDYGPDNACDRCGREGELYHNEATGLALCDGCDRITDEVEAVLAPPAIVTFKRLKTGAWGVTGPARLLVADAEIAVTKKSGETTTVTVGRVLWTGDGKTIATIRR
jgi:hypothetical protein